MTTTTFPPLMVAPAQVQRGAGILPESGRAIAALGRRPLIIGGAQALTQASSLLNPALANTTAGTAAPIADCSEGILARLHRDRERHQADVIIGVGGGKVMDAAKLVAYQAGLPVVTIPSSAATCAAWTALSNVYSDSGAFLYDVALDRCPDLLILDYDLVATAPQRTLIAGIGDALAKWYEGSVSSGNSAQTLVIAAVQQARVLRDLLLQKTPAALAEPGGEAWREVVDACVLLAGVMGGLGGAQCRTVAAHAVHNGLTHLTASHGVLHGEKVAYGILVQLRLEEMAQQSSLAYAARQQLIQFYDATGLPKTLADMGLGDMPISELQRAATIACQPSSDIHHLPFSVTPEALMAALVSPTAIEMKAKSSASTARSAIATAAQT
ncbi:MAG: iron-containing alcohol dehydrogenase family protein [Cyanobacteria bacterium P01_C01_bin.120]